MKTIIIGYADGDGLGKPVLVCGPNVEPQKQAVIMEDAANRQKFVKDFKRLEYIVLPDNPAQIAIYLGDDIAKSVAESEVKTSEAHKAIAAEQAKAKAEADKVQAAEAKVKELAAARNEILGKKFQAEVKFRNLSATPAELRNSNYSSLVEEISKALNGDPKEKIDGLEKQAVEASQAYEIAFQEWQALLKPITAAEVPAQKRQMNL